MVRQTNPRKDQKKNHNESNEIPLKTKRKKIKEKYRHQNNWLEEEEDDFDYEENLYTEEEEDYIFEDELDTNFDEIYGDENEENIQEENDEFE